MKRYIYNSLNYPRTFRWGDPARIKSAKSLGILIKVPTLADSNTESCNFMIQTQTGGRSFSRCRQFFRTNDSGNFVNRNRMPSAVTTVKLGLPSQREEFSNLPCLRFERICKECKFNRMISVQRDCKYVVQLRASIKRAPFNPISS